MKHCTLMPFFTIVSQLYTASPGNYCNSVQQSPTVWGEVRTPSSILPKLQPCTLAGKVENITSLSAIKSKNHNECK